MKANLAEVQASQAANCSEALLLVALLAQEIHSPQTINGKTFGCDSCEGREEVEERLQDLGFTSREINWLRRRRQAGDPGFREVKATIQAFFSDQSSQQVEAA